MSSIELKRKFSELKVGELRQELGKLGLDKNGVKAVLVERLVEYYESTKPDGGENTAVVTEHAAPIDAVPKTNENDTSMDVEEAEVSIVDNVEVEHEENVQGPETDLNEGMEGHKPEEIQRKEIVEERETEQDIEKENEETEREVTVEGNNQDGGGGGEQDEEVEEAEGGGIGGIDVSTGDQEDVGMEEDHHEDDHTNVEDEKSLNNENREEEEAAGEEEVVKKQDISNSTSSEISKDDQSQDNKVIEAGDSEEVSKRKEGERHIILVTGLSSNTSANDLKTFFRKYGKIGRIKIMTNTRVPGSQRFAHISVTSLDELNYLVKTLNGVQLKGKTIRVIKAPDDGSVSSSYEIAVATAREEEEAGPTENEKEKEAEDDKGNNVGIGGDEVEVNKSGSNESAEKGAEDDVVVQGAAAKNGTENKVETTKKKEEKKENEKKDKKLSPTATDKKSPEKSHQRSSSKSSHRSRKESHERNRDGNGYRPSGRGFRRDRNSVSTEWRRHGPVRGPMEITRVPRERPPMGRGHGHPAGGRRRSPHATQLTFEQIREIRDEQRRRDVERRKREEERERAAEVERQKRLEYQNYVEFKHLEREREKLRLERERIEREKLELIKLERERQKAEREKIEKEKEELRRAKMNIEHSHHRPSGLKRPYDDDKDRRRIETDIRKKPFSPADRSRPESKNETERKLDRDRYDRDRIHNVRTSEGRGRSPPIARESSRDPWGRGERVGTGHGNRTHSDERMHRRESDTLKASDRRGREAPLRTASGSSDMGSRYPAEPSHSSSRSVGVAKRPVERYDEVRPSTRDTEWVQRSSYLGASSSLSMPLSSSSAAGRESWPMTERKVEAWDTSRLAPRTEQWISGAGASVAGTGRSSLPVILPPPPIYSHAAAGMALPGSSLGLGNYTSDRYDGYKGSFLRRF